MFLSYLDQLSSEGRRSFTMEGIMKELSVSPEAARAGIYRLKKKGKLISPLSGFYVIVPPEHQPYGSIPAEELIPLIMAHLGADYYVSLLSAATYYGASHQKPARFQVISNKIIKHTLEFGKISIELIYKKTIEGLPRKNFVVSTGYLKVATPELIALDLFKYMKRAGGISHIATVLTELAESLNEVDLIRLAKDLKEEGQLQRLGYVVEQLDIMDEKKKKNILKKLGLFIQKYGKHYIPLVPYMDKKGAPRCDKWKIIENTDFESDL